MNPLNFKPNFSLLFLTTCLQLWLITPVFSLADNAALSASGSAGPVTESQPADVVGQNGETAPMKIISPVPATPTLTFTKTPTPTPTPKPDKNAKKTPTPDRAKAPFPTTGLHLPQVTTIPNPAYGDKVIFRVMTTGPAKVEIVVYDRFFNKVKELQGEGDRLFDVLWNFKKIPQGIYYYQAEVTDSATGGVQMLKMQSFAVMKDEDLPADP